MRQTGPGSKGHVNNLKGGRQCELPGRQNRCQGGATCSFYIEEMRIDQSRTTLIENASD